MKDVDDKAEHVPVMLEEVLEGLQPQAGKIFLDGTVGYGGHASALLAAARDASLIGLDRDQAALMAAQEKLAPFKNRVSLHHMTFQNFDQALSKSNISAVDGMLLDLGVSSPQLANAERGFSFQSTGPLDMRMDASSSLTATDIVNSWPEAKLADLIYELGEERLSRRYAHAIVLIRKQSKILTTKQLADIIEGAAPKRHYRRIHPATRTFQALRIAVNQELDELDTFLDKFLAYLNPHGRIAIIAYHSLEDRRVKQTFRKFKEQGQLEIVSKKPLRPNSEEIALNPRARSAKLRVAIKKEAA